MSRMTTIRAIGLLAVIAVSAWITYSLIIPHWYTVKPAIPFVTRGFDINLVAYRNNDNRIVAKYSRAFDRKFYSLKEPVVYGIDHLPSQFSDTTSTFTVLANIRGNKSKDLHFESAACTPAFMLRIDNNDIYGISYLTKYKPFKPIDSVYYLYNLCEMKTEPPLPVNEVNVSYQSSTAILLLNSTCKCNTVFDTA